MRQRRSCSDTCTDRGHAGHAAGLPRGYHGICPHRGAAGPSRLPDLAALIATIPPGARVIGFGEPSAHTDRAAKTSTLASFTRALPAALAPAGREVDPVAMLSLTTRELRRIATSAVVHRDKEPGHRPWIAVYGGASELRRRGRPDYLPVCCGVTA